MVVFARSLRQAELLQDSVASSFDTLLKLGDKPLREVGDPTLRTDMQTINEILSSRSDESILSMQENKAKEVVAKMKIYGMCHLICKHFYNVCFNVMAHLSFVAFCG